MMNIILFPFRLIGSIFSLIFGIISSVFGFVFGIIGSVFGLVGGLLNFLLSCVAIAFVVIGIVALIRWIARSRSDV